MDFGGDASPLLRARPMPALAHFEVASCFCGQAATVAAKAIAISLIDTLQIFSPRVGLAQSTDLGSPSPSRSHWAPWMTSKAGAMNSRQALAAIQDLLTTRRLRPGHHCTAGSEHRRA